MTGRLRTSLVVVFLIARVSVFESGIFLNVKNKDVERGNFFQLFSSGIRFKKFLGCIFIGLPIWFAIGILITFSPEFANVLNIEGKVSAGNAIMYSYIGLAVGDICSGVLSQVIKSRKKIVALFIVLTLIMIFVYLAMPVRTVPFFYLICFALGAAIGYWALFVTIAAEQFGTNLRSTVATSVPNFIRGMVIPMTLLFGYLRSVISSSYMTSFGEESARRAGIIYGAGIVGVLTVIIAFIAFRAIDETYGRDLNFEEVDT
jgi:MFS transporter, putative metabolite:H+ symporter